MKLLTSCFGPQKMVCFQSIHFQEDTTQNKQPWIRPFCRINFPPAKGNSKRDQRKKEKNRCPGLEFVKAFGSPQSKLSPVWACKASKASKAMKILLTWSPNEHSKLQGFSDAFPSERSSSGGPDCKTSQTKHSR